MYKIYKPNQNCKKKGKCFFLKIWFPSFCGDQQSYILSHPLFNMTKLGGPCELMVTMLKEGIFVLFSFVTCYYMTYRLENSFSWHTRPEQVQFSWDQIWNEVSVKLANLINFTVLHFPGRSYLILRWRATCTFWLWSNSGLHMNKSSIVVSIWEE